MSGPSGPLWNILERMSSSSSLMLGLSASISPPAGLAGMVQAPWLSVSESLLVAGDCSLGKSLNRCVELRDKLLVYQSGDSRITSTGGLALNEINVLPMTENKRVTGRNIDSIYNVFRDFTVRVPF